MFLNHLSYMLCLICALLVIIVDKSNSISINSDKNNSSHQLESIKPSPIDESAQILSEKSTDNNSNNAYLTKRDNTKEEIEQVHDDHPSIKDKKEKLTRKIPGGGGSSSFLNRDDSNCCGSFFQVSDQLETSVITTRATESSRYPSENNNRYGNRPDIDRYGWQTYPRPGQISSSSSSSSNSNSSPYGSQGNSPDRYGSRPPSSSAYEYGGRPGLLRPGYGYGYGYNDNNGAYGTNGYEINHRPSPGGNGGGGGGIHFTNRPGGYGGYGGMYGTNSEDNEFPTGSNAEEQPQSPASAHLQTQKAVALKALAGVALIGAAAALAANPVLLPLAGKKKKKKRSVSVPFDHQHFPYKFILDHVPHIQEKNIAEKFWNTPKCVSRLACEVQHEFFIQMSRDKSFIRDVPVIKKDIQRKLDELIIKGIFQSEDLQQSLEVLKKIAKQVENTKSNCNVFVCKLYAP